MSILDYRNYVYEDQKLIRNLNFLLKKIDYNLTNSEYKKLAIIKSIIFLNNNIKENYLLRPYNDKVLSLKTSFEKILNYIE